MVIKAQGHYPYPYALYSRKGPVNACKLRNRRKSSEFKTPFYFHCRLINIVASFATKSSVQDVHRNNLFPDTIQ